jgi:protein TonB
MSVLAVLLYLLASQPTAPSPPAATAASSEAQDEILNPVWRTTPQPRQVNGAYPMKAMQAEKTGTATIQCIVGLNGVLTKCSVLCESPRNFGFGRATLRFAPYFNLEPYLPDGSPTEGRKVRWAFFFNPEWLPKVYRCDKADIDVTSAAKPTATEPH